MFWPAVVAVRACPGGRDANVAERRLQCGSLRARRVARWMLNVGEGSPDPQFGATQEAIATALGLQRPAVNNAASTLRREGHIGYLRG